MSENKEPINRKTPAISNEEMASHAVGSIRTLIDNMKERGVVSGSAGEKFIRVVDRWTNGTETEVYFQDEVTTLLGILGAALYLASREMDRPISGL